MNAGSADVPSRSLTTTSGRAAPASRFIKLPRDIIGWQSCTNDDR
ncbi:hypothetical protein Y024_5891 [Burkholderia pseudomallei TSV44]|nr:hypothetical protein Y024_5891 [Burkholderia pseudomallei TSV44]